MPFSLSKFFIFPRQGLNIPFRNERLETTGKLYSCNHVTYGKQVDTLICHTTMCKNAINFLYKPDNPLIFGSSSSGLC